MHIQAAAVGEQLLRELPGGMAAKPRAATSVEFEEVQLEGYGPFRCAQVQLVSTGKLICS